MDTSGSRQITLAPDWKQFFFRYLFSILAIPLFGVGFVALYFVRRKHKSIRYKITDHRITSVDSKYQHNIDLENIREIDLHQSWLQKKLGIGTLELRSSTSGMKMVGMKDPEKLRVMIGKAVAAQSKPAGPKSYREYPDPEAKPGSVDKIDYLTGLWQQGLLSDEDYESEKGHFE